MNFINLTNGIEAISRKSLSLECCRFLRIQSSHCESKQWDRVLMSASDELLFRLAIGEVCTVYDYSQKGNLSRAVWQGLEWIKYVLCRKWFDRTYLPIGRCKDSGKYFEEQYKLLDKPSMARVCYYRKFLNTNRLKLYSVSSETSYDSDYNYYFNIIKEGL